jgi:hypothetical protein
LSESEEGVEMGALKGDYPQNQNFKTYPEPKATLGVRVGKGPGKKALERKIRKFPFLTPEVSGEGG